MNSIFILRYDCACWHFLLKQACINEVKTWHGKWSFSSILFQTLYVLTSSHMISRCSESTVFRLFRLSTVLKLLNHPLLALKLTFSLPTDCVMAVQLHGNPPHHNTTDWEPFLCLIFQPYSQAPLYLFKEGVMTTYRRNIHTRCSNGLNAFHDLAFISCCEMNPHFVNRLQKFSFTCPT